MERRFAAFHVVLLRESFMTQTEIASPGCRIRMIDHGPLIHERFWEFCKARPALAKFGAALTQLARIPGLVDSWPATGT